MFRRHDTSHNLLADWSREEKKEQHLQRNWSGWETRQPTWEQRYSRINGCVTRLYSGQRFDRYMRPQGCSKVGHEIGVCCQLLCIACSLYSTEPRCFWVQTDFQRLRQNYENFTRLHLRCRISCMQTHTWYIHTHSHTLTQTHRQTFPLLVARKKN